MSTDMTRIDAYVLYAGHDLHSLLDAAGIAPGPDVVRAVCGTVAVGWSP